MEQLRRADGATSLELERKCQENGWLMRGGHAWQDDPFMEEYPYDFVTADTSEQLRAYLGEGNHAIRQGIVYGDLAFVQQVNGGDEWWTLKRVDSGWTPFESVTFEPLCADRQGFERVVGAMRAATPEMCERLEYMEAAPITETAAAAREAARQMNGKAPDPQALRREQGRS